MRQIFCKLPNPFPYLNYITKFFFGRKSYRQRVFQGPLTLGLQSPSLHASSFRLACGNPSIPARSHIAALNRAPAVLHLSVRVGYNRRSLFAGALAGFPARVPARSFITAQTAHLLFCILLSASVTTDVCIPRVLSQVFLLGYPRAVLLPRKPRTCCFASFCPRRLQPTFALRGCARRFFLLGYPAQSYHRAKPRTCCFASFCPRRLQPTCATCLQQR